MAEVAIPSFEWIEIAGGSSGPGPRSRHCMVFDRGRKATVLFGGIIWGPTITLHSDTYEFKDGSWKRVKTTSRPPPFHRGGMAYDAYRGYSVFFGGQDPRNNLLAQTWLYSEGDWKEKRNWFGDRPQPRCGHCMAYDEQQRAVVLFGGIDVDGKPLGDTWIFERGTWKRVEGPAPHVRRYSAFAHDPILRGCLLHAGAIDDHGRMKYGDEWLFRDRVWTKLGDEFDTDPRDDQGMGFHEAANRMVMLEGVSGARGLITREAEGWQDAEVKNLHPRHQCAPLVWDDNLEGLVLHGGEIGHGGPQLDRTLVLKLSTNP